MMEMLLLREGWATRMESLSIFSLHTWQLLRLDEDNSNRMSRVRSRSPSASMRSMTSASTLVCGSAFAGERGKFDERDPMPAGRRR